MDKTQDGGATYVRLSYGKHQPQGRDFMRNMVIATMVGIFAAGPVFADDKADVMAQVHQFVDGLNKGDVKSALATCAEQTSIIDEFPPHEWHGAGACAKWASDYDANSKKEGITDGVVTLGKPRHVNITGDRAYVVTPTGYTWKQKGKAQKEKNATLTVALQKGAAGWRMVGWSWSTP